MRGIQRPLRRTRGLIVQELPDETLIFDRARGSGVCLARFPAQVWRRCDGKTSAAGITQALRDAGVRATPVLVEAALDELARASLLVDPPAANMSRRQALRGMAAAMVAVTTLVFSGGSARALPGSSLGARRSGRRPIAGSSLSVQPSRRRRDRRAP
jgi:hypothetical protein